MTVLMDTTLSMTYGRPTMIESHAATVLRLPLALDEQYLSRDTLLEHTHPNTQPTTMAFYIQALLLNKILHNILRAFSKSSGTADTDAYETWPKGGPNQGSERSLLELDQALTLWSNGLPPHLVPGNNVEGKRFMRQTNALRQRFLHTRMLIYRPILSGLIPSADTDISSIISPVRRTLLQRMTIHCSMLRVQAAQAAIQNICAQLPTEVGLMGPLQAWWYNVFYVYTAATVLSAARLRPFITAEISLQSIDLSWAHALEVLRRYEPCHSSAKRCVAVLQILFDRAPQNFERQRQSQEEREKREQIPRSTKDI